MGGSKKINFWIFPTIENTKRARNFVNLDFNFTFSFATPSTSYQIAVFLCCVVWCSVVWSLLYLRMHSFLIYSNNVSISQLTVVQNNIWFISIIFMFFKVSVRQYSYFCHRSISFKLFFILRHTKFLWLCKWCGWIIIKSSGWIHSSSTTGVSFP